MTTDNQPNADEYEKPTVWEIFKESIRINWNDGIHGKFLIVLLVVLIILLIVTLVQEASV